MDSQPNHCRKHAPAGKPVESTWPAGAGHDGGSAAACISAGRCEIRVADRAVMQSSRMNGRDNLKLFRTCISISEPCSG